MRRFVCVFLLCGVICVGSSCHNRQNTLPLGVNLELTGRLAWYGQATLRGITLAVEEINRDGGVNGKRIELRVLDNRSENAEAALAAIKLSARNQVLAIIGPSTSGGVKASLSAECAAPILVPSATADVLVPKSAKQNNMFRICYTDTMQGGAMAEFAAHRGFTSAALMIEASSDYARGMSEAFETRFTQLGGTIAAREYYTGGETDYGSILAKLKGRRFDVLFLPAYYTEAALVLRQLGEQGMSVPILSGDAFDSPALDTLVGNPAYLSDIYYSNHYDPGSEGQGAFAAAYHAAFGESPPAYAALGYDCARLFADAAARCKSVSPAEIAAQLARTVEFNGITGSITIDENHNAQKQIHIIALQNGVRSTAGEE